MSETVVRARLSGFANVSDVALLGRMRNSEEWLRSLCRALLQETSVSVFERMAGAVRILDGTIVKEPGKTGGQWRILYSLNLPSLICDCFEVTSTIGEGNGESLNRLPVVPNELILADAGYCSVAGIEYVRQQGADVLVRVNPQSFLAYFFQWQTHVAPSAIAISRGSGTVRSMAGVLAWETLLVCGPVVRGTKRRSCGSTGAFGVCTVKASKKQMNTRPGTLEFAKYVVVFTTRTGGSATQVLESYRMRWQIELAFKRLKSLVQLGQVPKHDDRSSRAWLYGKLLVALLTQKLIRIGQDISPSGHEYADSKAP